MKRTFALTTLTAVLTLVGATAFADDHIDSAIKARQAQMQLYAFSLGTLGAMAKGDVDYDAAAASAAADNLAAVTMLHPGAFWPQGSDSASNDKTRAKADMWSNFPDVQAKGMALGEAAVAMKAAAGTDLAALRGAIGAVGGACGACHKAYREPAN
ncbi:Cytochrome c-554 precursor [Shimia sp. SK013]|uniref:c-type cytochrome n=1 Tax=Shimia sp. SK013 TaxID=1389006 RepID=UPI0006B44134|nr:cytochrome c [Shimia sp. SK013]KPA22666.1 Cytochrome c-554 precursor [Shimia sp. SK013]